MKYGIIYKKKLDGWNFYEDLTLEEVRKLKLKDDFKTARQVAKYAVDAVNKHKNIDLLAEIWNNEKAEDLMEVDPSYTVEEVLYVITD